MQEWMELGCSPSDEDCVQASDENKNYVSEMEAELEKYKTMLENIFPQYKEFGCKFKIKWSWWDSTHQYGEVVIFYNPEIDEQEDFVYFVEENLPNKWEDLEIRNFVFTHRIPKCDQCDSWVINGIYCHEKGCINQNKEYSFEEKRWVEPQKSEFCNCDGEGCDLCEE